MDLFQVFSEATRRTSTKPIPTLSQQRSQELKNENIQLLRTRVQENRGIRIQTHYDTPRSTAFPNSRTGEEKVTELAERNAAANPDSQARHPSPPTPPRADGEKVDLSRIFNFTR